ncbi:MAG TPA: hypothetical protein PLZ32_02910 [Saprospiraceae bacterium]|nr:hypothetical protein [Saprospiraceae bacterium]
MRYFIHLSFLLIVLFAASCSSTRYTPFTEELKKEQRWSDRDLEKIQFYVSQDILLYRTQTSGESNIVDGKVVMTGGEKVETVVIRRGTPGQLVYNPIHDRFGISFEEKNDQTFLMFGPKSTGKGPYMLLAKEWGDKNGLITYGNKTYKTKSASAYASLMVELEKINKVQVDQKIASGRSIK